jgi:hypothetical protein
MDSWLVRQSKHAAGDTDIFGANSSVVDGFSAGKKRRGRKYQTDFLAFGFMYQLVNGEDSPQCVVCVEVLADTGFNARYLHRHLIKH